MITRFEDLDREVAGEQGEMTTATSCNANEFSALMDLPKDDLIRYAGKVRAALPNAGVVTSGRKADIAQSIVTAVANNPA